MLWYKPKNMKRQEKQIRVITIALLIVESAILLGGGTTVIITENKCDHVVSTAPALIAPHAILHVIEIFGAARLLKKISIQPLQDWKRRLLPVNIVRIPVLLVQCAVIATQLTQPLWIQIAGATAVATFHCAVIIAERLLNKYLVKPLIRGMTAEAANRVFTIRTVGME
ncbi:unnamed protein product [Caenorhabditis sp. 36 PRJEB53466]|nr:unnamed protein product [Caenorhabditis sp. 36 PRJEB53466]